MSSGSDYITGLPQTPSEYIEKELDPQIKKLATKANYNQFLFFTCRTIAIVGAVLLPVLVSFNEKNKGLIIFVSLCVTISVALEEAINFKSTYIKYQGLINLINKTKGEFITGEGDFANLNPDKRVEKFISLVSNIINLTKNNLLSAFESMRPPTKE